LTTARPVNTAQPKTTVNSARPMTNVFNKAHSIVKRPKAVLNAVKGNQVNAVKASACWIQVSDGLGLKEAGFLTLCAGQSIARFIGERSD
ncbi:hypothetical protein Tco_0192844, partial [Tanacetum coccineum]